MSFRCCLGLFAFTFVLPLADSRSVAGALARRQVLLTVFHSPVIDVRALPSRENAPQQKNSVSHPGSVDHVILDPTGQEWNLSWTRSLISPQCVRSFLSYAQGIVRLPEVGFAKLDPEEIANTAAYEFVRAHGEGRYPEFNLEDDRALLYTFCHNVARDLAKRESRHHRNREPVDVYDDRTQSCDNPRADDRESNAVEDQFELVRRLVSPSDWRIVQRLRLGASTEQIAAELEMTPAGVHTAMYRVRAAVARHMNGGEAPLPQPDPNPPTDDGDLPVVVNG